MATCGSVPDSLPMTSPSSPAVTTTTARDCCRRPMSSIEVTTRGASLVLHSCTACGRHIWEKDGVVADRADLLDGVASFLEQPREIVRRRSRKRTAEGTPPAR